MVFSSLLFLFRFLPVVLLIYYLSPMKYRNLLLLLANLVFYGWGEPVYVSLMVFSTVVDYTHGLLVERYRDDDRRARRVVASSVAVNLGLLLFFKYFDFFVENLHRLGMLGRLQPLGVPLPIGISFYTFQTMSYTLDVYRGDSRAQKNIIAFGTYVSLFPQLIAGPIVRYKDVARQLTGRTHGWDGFAYGVRRFVIGLGKKVLLANNIGALWDVYSAMPADERSVLGAWLGIAAFAFQIYFDFSGYSDMAIGLGNMFGFSFLENFDYPYTAKSVTEFWRRWHISLGTWFREYVYIPLGGNREGTAKTVRNLLIVWCLTGFWHGASWNFLFWGLYYGVLLVIERLWLGRVLDRLPGALRHGYLLLMVLLGWVLFAVEDTGDMGAYFLSLFGAGQVLFSAAALYRLRTHLVLLAVLALASTPLPRSLYRRIPGRMRAVADPVLIVFVLLLSTAYLVDSSYNPFLYFRF